MTWAEMYRQLSPSENFQFWFGVINTAILVVTAVLVFVQIRLGVVSLQKDHDRRRLESTMDHIREIRTRNLLQKVYSEIGVEAKGAAPLTEAQLQKIEENPKVSEEVRELLGIIEQLAVGVHAEVFDINVLNRMSGYYLLAIAARFGPYIDRQRARNKDFYREFTELIAKLKEMRRKANQKVPGEPEKHAAPNSLQK